jgi:predicted RNA methylase
MKISNDVLAVLSAGTTSGNQYFLPSGQLDRAMYTKVNKVLESAGGKWSRSAKAHVFGYDAEQRMDEIIVSGEVDVPKDEFEFFPTPAAIADRMHEVAQVETYMHVLEPSAGRGALVHRLEDVYVHCVEKMPANAKYLREEGYQVEEADFMDVPQRKDFDRVLMNPPFSKGQDVKHVTHAIGFLKPGGRLVAIMGAGVTFRQDKRTTEFRELVESMGGTIDVLPEGSFKSSGTMVSSVIVKIDL